MKFHFLTKNTFRFFLTLLTCDLLREVGRLAVEKYLKNIYMKFTLYKVSKIRCDKVILIFEWNCINIFDAVLSSTSPLCNFFNLFFSQYRPPGWWIIHINSLCNMKKYKDRKGMKSNFLPWRDSNAWTTMDIKAGLWRAIADRDPREAMRLTLVIDTDWSD